MCMLSLVQIGIYKGEVGEKEGKISVLSITYRVSVLLTSPINPKLISANYAPNVIQNTDILISLGNTSSENKGLECTIAYNNIESSFLKPCCFISNLIKINTSKERFESNAYYQANSAYFGTDVNFNFPTRILTISLT